MSWPRFAIRRPVLAVMLNAVFIVFGFVAYWRIGFDRFPQIDFPVVSVQTQMLGADPSIIDSSVTSPLASSVNGVPGTEAINSFSSPNVSRIVLQFQLNKNVDVAFNEVQARVNQGLSQLPKEASSPVVAKIEFGSQPILWLALTGGNDRQALNLYAKNTLKKRLESIDGVGQVALAGERERVWRVELNLERLKALNLTFSDIMNALQRAHVRLPGGFVTDPIGLGERLLDLDLEFHQISDLQNLIIRQQEQSTIRLKDVATVQDDLEDIRRLARFNGKEAIGLGIIKVSNANTVAVIDTVKQALAQEIGGSLPFGYQLHVASDEGASILEIVNALRSHLWEGTLLTALVVWLFLKNWRSTLIVCVTIPVSLLGTVACMYFLGFTFNIMTLLALLLLIGVVVDDAIVVIENIVSRLESNARESVPLASAHGAEEVIFSVVASTLTLAAIFIPVIFLDGILGRFFYSFAMVVAIGVMISLWVSVTLTPVLSAFFLKAHVATRVSLWDRGLQSLDHAYALLLSRVLQKPSLVFLGVCFLLGGSFWVGGQVRKEFLPTMDQGNFMVRFKTALGSPMHETQLQLDVIEAQINQIPEVENIFSAVGTGPARDVTDGFVSVKLTPKAARKRSQSQIVALLNQKIFDKLPGVRLFITDAGLTSGERNEPFQFVIRGPNLTEVKRLAQQIQHVLSQDPRVGPLDSSVRMELPQYRLELDRDALNATGIAAQQVIQNAPKFQRFEFVDQPQV